MRKALGSVLAVALLAMVPAVVVAQSDVSVGVGGGVTLPIGDYGDADKLGFHVGAGVSFGLGTAPIRLGVDGGYSQTSHDGVGGKTKIAGGMANIIYPIPTAGSVKPYIMGGVGYFNVKVDVTGFGSASESKVGFGGGAGLSIGSGLFVQGKFVSISTSGSSINMIFGTVGYRFALGSK